MYFHPAYVDLQAYWRERPDRRPVPLRGEFLAFHHRCFPPRFWDDHGRTHHPGGGTGKKIWLGPEGTRNKTMEKII
jgi:hypothetical protein